MSYKRSVINMQIPIYYEHEHIWVDLWRGGVPAGYSSYGGQTANADAQGYANSTSPTRNAGLVWTLPTLGQYGGYYVMTGRGSGSFTGLNNNNVLTWNCLGVGVAPIQDGITYQSGYGFSGFLNGNFDVSDASSGWRIILWRSDHDVGEDGAISRPSITTTNTSAGGYLRDVSFYRIDNETYFNAGEWYDRRWKQSLINLNPAAIRFMTWTAGAGSIWRWSNRPPPDYIGNWGGFNFNTTRYDATTFPSSVDHTAYSVSSNAVGMPSSMQHGEQVYTIVSGDWQTAGGNNSYGGEQLSGLIVNPGSSTQSLAWAHLSSKLKVNDPIQFFGCDLAGMPSLNYLRANVVSVSSGATITSVTGSSDSKITVNGLSGTIRIGDNISGTGIPSSFDSVYISSQSAGVAGSTGVYTLIGLSSGSSFAIDLTGVSSQLLYGFNEFVLDCDISSRGTFGSGFFGIYLTLEVGGRGAYPIRSYGGQEPASFFRFMPAGFGRTFHFDKNIPAYYSSSGAVTYGTWVIGTGTDQADAPPGVVAPEYIPKLINELEDMIIEQGSSQTKGPINPWVCTWPFGLLTTDADYSSNDHCGIGLIDTILNGNPTYGISGIPSRCDVFNEYANETWNIGAFNTYHVAVGTGRWGPTAQNVTEPNSMTVIRAVQLRQDINAAFSSATSRIKHVLGGFEINGLVDATQSITNWPRCFGNSLIFNDSSATVSAPSGANPVYYQTAYSSTTMPVSFFWGFATAPYLYPSATWTSNNLTNSINAWKANGQYTIASLTNGTTTTITTTVPHTISSGDVVVLTNLVQPSTTIPSWNGRFTPVYGIVTNPTSNTFDINLDSVFLSSVTGGNVTRINGTDQETVYASFLQWMDNSGLDSQDLSHVYSRCRNQYTAQLNPYGVFHLNYEGWEETIAQQQDGVYDDTKAFYGSCKRSTSLANIMTTFFENKKNVYGSYMPSCFTQEDPGRWGFLFPDAYGFSSRISASYPVKQPWNLSPAWTAMGNYNDTAGRIQFSVTLTS